VVTHNVPSVYGMSIYSTCFFYCLYVRFLRGLVQITFSISPPQNIQHLFSRWINQVRGKLKRQLLTGALVFCWAIWLSRNNVIFDKAPIKSFMKVLYRGTHWLHFWSHLESDEKDKKMFTSACSGTFGLL
jgi:hypothetical protein